MLHIKWNMLLLFVFPKGGGRKWEEHPQYRESTRTHSSANAKADWRGMSRISGYGTVVPNSGGDSSNNMTDSSFLLHFTVVFSNVLDSYPW